jgi:catechol 2,3-dioxygenase-like lactoylglutathione lyase family enzyme
VNVWYRVADLEAACRFYVERLGFTELYRDDDGRWARLELNGVELSIAEEGEEQGEDGAVFTADATDLRAQAERLREAGVEVGVVVEIPGSIRILDVFDPDGNRLQLTEDL